MPTQRLPTLPPTLCRRCGEAYTPKRSLRYCQRCSAVFDAQARRINARPKRHGESIECLGRASEPKRTGRM